MTAQSTPLTGITQDKEALRTALEEAVFAVSEPLAALAAATNNNTLLAEVEISRSALDDLSADAVDAFATRVATRADHESDGAHGSVWGEHRAGGGDHECADGVRAVGEQAAHGDLGARGADGDHPGADPDKASAAEHAAGSLDESLSYDEPDVARRVSRRAHDRGSAREEWDEWANGTNGTMEAR
jgi:hypothetical protein